MNWFEIRKTFKFEAAHRLMSSWSKKCQQIHGHSYKLEVILGSEELNEDGMVIDFGQLKELMQKHLEQFDHQIVICDKDNKVIKQIGDEDGEELGYLFVPFNPTAENMAKYFYDILQVHFYKNEEIRHIQIVAVRVHETETGYAEYRQR